MAWCPGSWNEHILDMHSLFLPECCTQARILGHRALWVPLLGLHLIGHGVLCICATQSQLHEVCVPHCKFWLSAVPAWSFLASAWTQDNRRKWWKYAKGHPVISFPQSNSHVLFTRMSLLGWTCALQGAQAWHHLIRHGKYECFAWVSACYTHKLFMLHSQVLTSMLDTRSKKQGCNSLDWSGQQASLMHAQ